jgi:hypothetical protein
MCNHSVITDHDKALGVCSHCGLDFALWPTADQDTFSGGAYLTGWNEGKAFGAAKKHEEIVAFIKGYLNTWSRPTALNFRRELENLIQHIESDIK